MTSTHELVDEIASGAHDESLSALLEAVKHRNGVLAARAMRGLEEGARVRVIQASGEQRWLKGQKGTVKAVRGTKVQVLMDIDKEELGDRAQPVSMNPAGLARLVSKKDKAAKAAVDAAPAATEPDLDMDELEIDDDE